MAEHQPFRLILASASSGRRRLLEQAGLRFEVIPSNVDEPDGVGVKDIRAFVQQVAWLKAAAVAPKIDRGIVLAADSVGWIEGQVIAKPANRADARIGPIPGHKSGSTIRAVSYIQIAAERIAVAEGLRQTFQGVKELRAICPEA